MKRNDFTTEVRYKAKITLNCFKTNCQVAESGTHQVGRPMSWGAPLTPQAGLTRLRPRHKLQRGRQSQQE